MHAENLNGFIIIECAGLGWRRRAGEDGERGRPRPRRRSKRPSVLPPRVRAHACVRACVRSLPPCRASPSLVSITCLLPFLSSSSPPRVASERERVGAGGEGRKPTFRTMLLLLSSSASSARAPPSDLVPPPHQASSSKPSASSLRPNMYLPAIIGK